jgi:hypothetical protein
VREAPLSQGTLRARRSTDPHGEPGRSGKHILDNLAMIRLILDDQNAFAHAFFTFCSTRTGKVKANVEP